MTLPRLAYVVSHPIQYQAPLLRRLSSSGVLDLTVLFQSAHGVAASWDPGFEREVAYDVPLLEGYRHRFLRNRSLRPGIHSFSGLINPGLFTDLREFDAVLVHGYAHMSDWIAFASTLGRRLPLLVRGESHPDKPEVSRRPLRRARRLLLSTLHRQVSACLAIGELSREFYRWLGVPAERIYFSPYCVDNEFFENRSRAVRKERGAWLRAHGLNANLPVVLFAAKLQPWKRPLDFVAALRHLEGEVNAIVIGDGPLRSIVQMELASIPSARYIGFVNQTEIAAWYGAADIFVLPSEREPWGLAVNEAIAGGAVPIVTDAVGSARDLVANGGGLVVPVGDRRRLADAIGQLAKNPSQRETSQRVASARLSRFTIDAAAAGVEEAVSDVLG